MDNTLIPILALWMYPILGLVLVLLALKSRKHMKVTVTALAITSMLSILCHITGISTIWPTLDWFIFTIPYLSICGLLWGGIFKGKVALKVISFNLAVGVFGLGYWYGSVASLGLLFKLSEYHYSNEQRLDDRLTFKEATLGNALTDYRGKKVSITRTFRLIPFLEREIANETFFGIEVYIGLLEASYNSELRKVYLVTSIDWAGSTLTWEDQIDVN